MSPLGLLASVWTVRRGRRAAVARLRPFVERSRASPGGEPDWGGDHGLGFLLTLITRTAQALGPIGPDALALIQRDAWASLTGQDAALVGPRATLLSLDGGPDFVAGCRAALAFDEAQGGAPDPDAARRRDLFALWERCAHGDPTG